MSITIKVKGNDVKLDNSQSQAFFILDNIISDIANKSNNSSFFSKFFKKSDPIIGLYLYGRVGRGKSMLMQNFFDKFPLQNKMYLHFNSFMQQIHRQLYAARKDKSLDPESLIETVTNNIIKNNKLICLDEFQVDDVTDALILRRIFSFIFNKGVIVIFTSNSKPENLYQNGLQRDLFLKFVDETLKVNCQIFNLDSETDYREKFLHKVKKHYFFPLNKENNDKIMNIFSHLIHENDYYEEKITVLGRDLLIPKVFDNIAVFEFNDLCCDNLGVADYQAICGKYNIIFLLNIPKLTKEDKNEAKRLILFIDEVYENKITLLISSEVAIDDIYDYSVDSKSFKRTISRLKEIMSDDYGKMVHFERVT